MADVEDQVNSHSDEEQSEEEVPKGKDESESEPESEVGIVYMCLSHFVLLGLIYFWGLFRTQLKAITNLDLSIAELLLV